MAAVYDEKLGKYVVTDRKEGLVVGYYAANSKDEAVAMAKADQARWSIGE